MELQKIEDLLEKYWSGETTDEEEKVLKDYFLSDDVAPHLNEVSNLFNYYEEERSSKILDSTFDDEVLQLLEKDKKQIHFSRKSGWSYFMKVAAVIAIIFTSVAIFNSLVKNQGKKLAIEDTYNDPEKAYEVTRKALMMVSKNLNKGGEYASEISRFSETKIKVENHIK